MIRAKIECRQARLCCDLRSLSRSRSLSLWRRSSASSLIIGIREADESLPRAASRIRARINSAPQASNFIYPCLLILLLFSPASLIEARGSGTGDYVWPAPDPFPSGSPGRWALLARNGSSSWAAVAGRRDAMRSGGSFAQCARSNAPPIDGWRSASLPLMTRAR